MKRLAIILVVLISLQSALGSQESDTLHLAVNAQVMVFDRSVAADELADWAVENGGYFTWKSEESIRIRVPDEKAIPFRAYLEDLSEVMIDYNQSAYDLREDLNSSRSALEAREEILLKNLSYLSSSDVEGTLELEKEIRRLMGEIDGYRGMLRRLEHDRKMAVIDVSLSFRQQTIPDRLPSNFSWINDMDFYRFINSSMYQSGGLGLGVALIDLPVGFALIDKSPVFLAISAEGVRLRVRKIDNYPEQSAEFWAKALESDLRNRGYLAFESVGKKDWGGEVQFTSSLWALPLGNEDYLYLTSLRLKGGKLEVLEMAGKAEYMMSYLK